MTHGSFRFLDGAGRPVATFEGVNFRSNLRNAAELRGDASIAKTSLRNRFFLEQLKTPLRYDAAELDLSQITARAAGARSPAVSTCGRAIANSPFDVRVKFRESHADRVVSEAGGPEGMVKGRLEGISQRQRQHRRSKRPRRDGRNPSARRRGAEVFACSSRSGRSCRSMNCAAPLRRCAREVPHRARRRARR